MHPQKQIFEAASFAPVFSSSASVLGGRSFVKAAPLREEAEEEVIQAFAELEFELEQARDGMLRGEAQGPIDLYGEDGLVEVHIFPQEAISSRHTDEGISDVVDAIQEESLEALFPFQD